LSIIANISLALGITNLLPIPALDGGRILFTLPELLFKKRIPQKWENAVNTVSFPAADPADGRGHRTGFHQPDRPALTPVFKE
jgi:hypothetical protein